jgi:MtaA/CmuA family methyltransferase
MPVTMMFAADRIGARYGKYATDHRVLVEAQISTAEEFDFDYVSCISDPAREAADCGAKVEYFENQPPALDERDALLIEKRDLTRLKMPDPAREGRMRDRVEAAGLFKKRVGETKLIEGWVEGPMAMAADLRGINTVMLDFYEDPSFVRDLFAFCVELAIRFAKAQIEAGADLIGVGDAAASLVGPNFYDDSIWPYEKRLVDGIHAAGGMVRLHICGDTRHHLEGMGKLGCEIVDLDWMAPLSHAREKMGPHQVLLGNIDPVAVLRNGTPDDVYNRLLECSRQAGPRYIIGAGCEIPRDTPPENVHAMRRIG